MAKVLYLLRGVPGAGKSKLAETLGCPVFSADDFYVRDGEYKFLPSFLGAAHSQCQNRVETSMECGVERIAVANTFTREWEMDAYYVMAEKHGYTVFSVIVENRHNGKNVHGVPDEKVEAMRSRFQVKL